MTKLNQTQFLENLKKIKARVHSIETFGAVDGPGVRFVLFLQGCHLRCLYCHNPDSWDARAGQSLGLRNIIENILAYKDFYKKGGVTISGGEPMVQHQFLFELLCALEMLEIHTAIDTNGFVDLRYSQKCIDKANMLLLDMKEVTEKDCVALTGKGLKNAIATLNYCEKTKKPVWIRFVCVPGYTLKDEKLHTLGKFLQDYACVEKVQPIAFHQLGSYKYKELNIAYQLNDTPTPTNEEMHHAQNILKSYGLNL